jgi:hypothetical protein
MIVRSRCDVCTFYYEFKHPSWSKLYARHTQKRAQGVEEWPVMDSAGTILFVTYERDEEGRSYESFVEMASPADWK